MSDGVPTAAEQAAIRLAARCLERGPLLKEHVVYMILNAQRMPWYEMLVEIETSDQQMLTGEGGAILRNNCATFKSVIDRGYDQDQDRWWVFQDETERLALMAVVDTLERSSSLSRSDGLIGLRAVASMLLGVRWRQEYTAIRRAAGMAKRVRFT